MGLETVKVATCDECDETIDLSGEWINATVYGVVFHVACWEKIGGPRVARVLYLDDVAVNSGETVSRKAWGERR